MLLSFPSWSLYQIPEQRAQDIGSVYFRVRIFLAFRLERNTQCVLHNPYGAIYLVQTLVDHMGKRDCTHVVFFRFVEWCCHGCFLISAHTWIFNMYPMAFVLGHTELSSVRFFILTKSPPHFETGDFFVFGPIEHPIFERRYVLIAYWATAFQDGDIISPQNPCRQGRES